MKYSVSSWRQSGFSLIETMIAILLISFGLLGMLLVTTNSLKLTGSSNYRTIAIHQAHEMADIVRGNPGLLTSYASPSNTSTSSCFTSSGCTASQLVNSQFALWKSNLGIMLPSGDGTICRDSSPGDGTPTDWSCDGTQQYVVKVCWQEAHLAVSGSDYLCIRVGI